MKNKTPKKPKAKEDNSPIKFLIEWGWQVDALVYTIAANFIIATTTLLCIILRK